MHNVIFSIYQDATGVLWFGGWGGVNKYDGKEFVSLMDQQGLAGNHPIVAISEGNDGEIWFGGRNSATRFDGVQYVTLTKANGLAYNVRAIHRGSDGVMWFGTAKGGVCRYDGKAFETFTTKDGLADKTVKVRSFSMICLSKS